MLRITKNRQYYKFCFYGFLKNLRFFDAFFLLILIDRGLPYTQIGLLYAIREIIVNVFEIPSGIIADAFGRKRTLIFSFLIAIFSFLTFYFATNFWLFLLAFSLYGIADAFRSGTHKGMIMTYLKINNWEKQKINYYGHTRSWSQAGSAISSLAAGIIVFFTGKFDNIFLYSIVPYLLNFLLVLSYPNELDKALNSNKNEQSNRFSFVFFAFLKSIKQIKVLRVINTSALHSAYIKSLKDYIQPLMISIALIIPIFQNIEIEKKNGIIIGVLYFAIYLITSQASRVSAIIHRATNRDIPYMSLLIGFAFGILSGVFYLFDFWIFSILAFVGIYVVENIRKPILTGYIADNVPNDILTSVISAQSQLKTLITTIIALGFGIIADSYNIGTALFVVSLTLFILSIIVNLSLRRK